VLILRCLQDTKNNYYSQKKNC